MLAFDFSRLHIRYWVNRWLIRYVSGLYQPIQPVEFSVRSGTEYAPSIQHGPRNPSSDRTVGINERHSAILRYYYG